MPPTPDIPLFDLALGLASAVLLLAAALYLVRSRSAVAPGLPPLRYSKSESTSGDLFAEFVSDQTLWRLSLVGSLFLHVALVACLPLIELFAPAELMFDMNRYDVVILQYQIRDRRLTIPSDLVVPDAPPSPKDLPDSQTEPLGLPDAKTEQTQRAQGPGVGPVIDLKAEKTPPVEPALAGMALPVAPAVATRPTPQMQQAVAWDVERQQDESLAQMHPARFVPGQDEASPENSPSLADLGLSAAPEVATNSALPVPDGLFSPDGEFLESISPVSGPPALAAPASLGDGYAMGWRMDDVMTMVLKAVLQSGPLGQFFGGIAGSVWGGDGGNRSFRAGAADGPEGGGFGRGRLTPVPRKFHGIILVSNALSTLPEAMGVLSGNPVYTVYVDVPDAPRKWILQFCVPRANGSSIEVSGEVVHVLNRKTLDPPFATHKEPFRLDAPSAIDRVAQMPERIVAYGTVDAEGNLHDVRIIRGADPKTDDRILASLRNWEFVPAFRDGQPVAVEALFGIPLY